MLEAEYKHGSHKLKLKLCQPRSKTHGLTSTPTNITERRLFRSSPPRVKFPRVWIYLRIEMDIAKRINNVGPSGYYFVVDINFWTNIASHSCVRLSDACRFSNNSVKDGS